MPLVLKQRPRRCGTSPAVLTRYQIAITPKGNPAYGIRLTSLRHREEAFALARQWAREDLAAAGINEPVEISVTDRMARARCDFRWTFERAAAPAA